MTVLHLGVVDIPYSAKESTTAQRSRVAKNRKAPRQPAGGGTISTGDVAEILEEKYHIFEVFFETAKSDIATALEDSLAGALESVMQGAGNGPPPFAEAESAIKERFDAFITNREMEALGYSGVPTQAAIDGVSHRLKHPYAKGNPRRPSFVDTGLYLASFVAEIDG